MLWLRPFMTFWLRVLCFSLALMMEMTGLVDPPRGTLMYHEL